MVPFDDDVQEKLDKSEVRGIAGGRLLKIEPYEELSDNGKLTAEALGFLKGISEITVENADDGLMYYMEGIYVDDDSVTVEIIDSDDNIYDKILHGYLISGSEQTSDLIHDKRHKPCQTRRVEKRKGGP